MIQFGANFSVLSVPKTGLSPTITIRDTASGAVVVSAAAMTEVGEGAYKYDFANDITKEYSASIDGGLDSLDSRYLSAWSERVKSEAEIVLIKDQTDKMNFAGTDIKATLDGEEVITDTASREASKADVSSLSDIAIDLKRLLGLSQENYRLFNPVYNTDDNLLSVTTKIYSTAADCNNDTNAIAEYVMEATYSNKQLDTYKVVKT